MSIEPSFDAGRNGVRAMIGERERMRMESVGGLQKKVRTSVSETAGGVAARDIAEE